MSAAAVQFKVGTRRSSSNLKRGQRNRKPDRPLECKAAAAVQSTTTIATTKKSVYLIIITIIIGSTHANTADSWQKRRPLLPTVH